MKTKTKIRWFWSWNDTNEETWLREMSKQGWHLRQVEAPIFYTFEQGDSSDIVYRLDTPASQVGFGGAKAAAIDETEYQQIFKDAGWRYHGINRGWRYFSKSAASENIQEIYTDNASRIAMYHRRMLYQLAILLLVSFYTLLPAPREILSLNAWVIPRLIMIAILVLPLIQFRRRILQLQ